MTDLRYLQNPYNAVTNPTYLFTVEGYSRDPLLNSLLPAAFPMVLTQPPKHKDLMEYFKVTPECVTFVQALVTDIISDGIYFEGASSNVKKAMDFLETSYFQDTLEGALFDMFIEGNGFIYKQKPSQDDVKEFVQDFIKRKGFIHTKEIEETLIKEAVNDEEATKTRALKNIASTTVNIIPHDKFASVLYYEQRVGSFISRFYEDEIIQFKDINLNGELWGFSRMRSILNEVQMLMMNKDYQGAFFNNHGLPDGVLTLPNSAPNSPDYELIKGQLEDSKKVKERHRIMLFTGEVNWHMFERMKDMEFKNLADYLTKVIAMVYQVPPSRYGGSGQSSEETTLSNQGYYRNIAHNQNKIEAILNGQFWMPEFKVHMRFKRTYKEDEVRESQVDKIRTDVAEQRMKLGLFTREAALRYLLIDPDDAPSDEEAEKLIALSSGKLNQGESTDQAMLDEPQQKKNANKSPKSRSEFSNVR